MRIVVAGGSGLIGGALRRQLAGRGDSVVQLVRRPPAGSGEQPWDPDAGVMSSACLDGVDAVVNLCGSPIAVRWTMRNRRLIVASRVGPTATLVTAIARYGAAGPALVQGSAIGFYGDRGEERLTEQSGKGAGFVSDVVSQWELAAAPAEQAGLRVVYARTGLVLSDRGGALAKLAPLIRAGLGGAIGSGRQWWSWITLADEVSALLHLIDSDVAGPVNLVAPRPSRQLVVVKALAAAARRPAVVPAPGWALRAAIGGFAREILASQRIRPAALEASGFDYEHPNLAAAAAAVMRPAR